MKRLALLSVLFAVSGVLSASFSLRDAQQLLLENNHTIRGAELELEKAEAAVKESKAAWLPSVDANASTIVNSQMNRIDLSLPIGDFEQEFGTYDRTEFGIDISYPFFTGFARKYGIVEKREEVRFREAMLEGAKNRLFLQLGILYLRWYLSFREADLYEILCTQLSVRSRQIEEQYEAGVVLHSRLLEVQARKRMADADLVASLQKTDSLRYELLSFVGGSGDSLVPDTSATAFDFSLPPEAGEIDTTRPELIGFSKSRLRIDYLRRVLKSSRMPVVAGMAGVRYARPGLAMGDDSFMGYGLVGVKLSWKLFDGFKYRARDEQLRLQSDLIAEEREASYENFEKMHILAVKRVKDLDTRLAAVREAQNAAEALAEDLEQGVDAGVVTQADYLNALAAVTQSRLAVERVVISGKMAVLQALYAAGTALTY